MSRRGSADLQDGHVHPPGTVDLFRAHSSDSGGGDVVLIPTPSGDPDDPLSWPMWRKAINFAFLSAMTVAVFTALSTQPLFWGEMLEELPVTLQALTSAQSVQLAGLAVGCIFFIPFTIKFGRRTPYLISTVIVAAASWWSSRMNTTWEIYLTNFIIGLAGATNETAVQMSIRDMFFVHQRGTANGIYFAAVMAGTFITPMAAGSQAVATGWRSSYATLAAVMTAMSGLFAIAFEETKYVPVIQGAMSSDHAAVYDPELGPKDAKYAPSIRSMHIVNPPAPRRSFPRNMRLQLITKTDESLLKTFFSPLSVWWFPHVLFTSFQIASGICWLTIVGSFNTIIFSEPPYNFSPAQIGFLAGGPCVGTIFGSLYGGLLTDKAIVWLSKRNGGVFDPEMRLYMYPLPAIGMAAGFVIYCITADRGMHWIYPSIGGAIYAFGLGSISDIAFTLSLDSFPNVVGQTFVVISFLRNALSLVGPFSVTPWMEVMSVSNIGIMGGGISLAISALAIPLVIWGKKSRIALTDRYNRLSEKYN